MRCGKSVVAGLLCITLLLDYVSAESGSTSQCIISPTECTCSEQVASGTCTRPASSETTCLQGDCTESFRCDCWGFEKCSISSCKNYTPVANAIPSRNVEFQCKLETTGSQCRRVVDYMDSVESAENARDAVVVYVEVVVVEEREIAIELAKAMNYKIQVLDAFHALDRHYEALTEAEIKAVTDDAEVVMGTVEEVAIDLAQVVAESKGAYGNMVETTRYMRAATASERIATAKEEEEAALQAQAAATNSTCATCEALRQEVTEARAERRRRSKLAAESAKKARDAKKKCKSARRKAHEKQVAAESAKERCIAKSNAALARIAAL
jgi:hypothetical protein